MTQISKEESRRLHIDWWGKCRTCRFWASTDPRRMEPAQCTNPRSNMLNQETWTEGHCPQWDSFDIDTALEVLDE